MDGGDKRYSRLSIVMLFAASLFKISAYDLLDARSLPLLMRSIGYLRAAKRVSILAALVSKSASSLQSSHSLRN